MTDDNDESKNVEQEVENYRNTFKARAKGKLKRWYIEGNNADAINGIADQFRKEADIIFSGENLDEHLQYVELLVDAGRRAVEDSPVDPNDPDLLFTHDPSVSSDDLKRDGERFEQAIDELREQKNGEAYD